MQNLKEFNKLIRLCKKLGIEYYKCADFEVILNKESLVRVNRKKVKLTMPKETFDPTKIDETDENIPTAGMTQEELLFWSSDIAGKE